MYQYTCQYTTVHVTALYNPLSSGEDGSALSPAGLTAHRRRTDLVPTIVMPRTSMVSGAVTPGSRHRSPGMMSVSMSRIPQSQSEDSGARTSGVSSSKELVTSLDSA